MVFSQEYICYMASAVLKLFCDAHRAHRCSYSRHWNNHYSVFCLFWMKLAEGFWRYLTYPTRNKYLKTEVVLRCHIGQFAKSEELFNRHCNWTVSVSTVLMKTSPFITWGQTYCHHDNIELDLKPINLSTWLKFG